MERIEPSIREVFVQLAKHPEISARVCAAIADNHFTSESDLRTICTLARVAQSQSFLVEKVLLVGESVGLFKKTSHVSWRPTGAADYGKLSILLEGASIYKEEVYRDINTVRVVLTKPPDPSKLEEMMGQMGYKAVFIENTSEIFADMASTSKHDFVIVTPFLDTDGSKRVMELLRKTPAKAHKHLVLRSPKGTLVPSLKCNMEELKSLGVQVFNYWIPKEQKGTYETFHVKLVSSDSKRCYVGSANMTRSSFSYSMELGFLVEGEAAQTVGWVCKAIIGASHPISLV